MSQLRKFDDIVRDLHKIKKHGYHKTIRSGDTGIGATLENLLGMTENNIAGPNGHQTELKSARIGGNSYLTLFTKSPSPRGINNKLVAHYGYPDEQRNNRNILHTTINSIKFNKLKGNPGFRITLSSDQIQITYKDGYDDIPTPYWTRSTLEAQFNKKYPHRLLYVKANSKNTGINEEFHYIDAYELSEFSFKRFLDLLRDGNIVVDVRLGLYSDGRTHDHGTGFRIDPTKLDLCFAQRNKVL